MNRRLYLPLTLLIAGLVVTAVHDYAYRRVDDGDDVYVWGLTSYAGSVMIGLTILLTLVGALSWHRGRFFASLALLATGAVATVIHDAIYRWIYSRSGDYELGGLVSHAGSDMIIVTAILVLIALFWPGER